MATPEWTDFLTNDPVFADRIMDVHDRNCRAHLAVMKAIAGKSDMFNSLRADGESEMNEKDMCEFISKEFPVIAFSVWHRKKCCQTKYESKEADHADSKRNPD